MNRSIRRARAARARNHVATVRAIKDSYSSATHGDDDRPLTRSTIGYGRPRSRKDRSDENRSNYGVKPVQPRRAAIAEQVA